VEDYMIEENLHLFGTNKTGCLNKFKSLGYSFTTLKNRFDLDKKRSLGKMLITFEGKVIQTFGFRWWIEDSMACNTITQSIPMSEMEPVRPIDRQLTGPPVTGRSAVYFRTAFVSR